MNPVQNTLDRLANNQAYTTQPDPNNQFDVAATETARQLATVLRAGAGLAGKGIGWGANEIQQGIQHVINPSPNNQSYAQTPLIKSTAKKDVRMTPTPTVMNKVTSTVVPQHPSLPTTTPTPTSQPQQGGIPQQISGLNQDVSSNFLNLLQKHVLPITRQYGIPDAVVAGQMAQESAFAQKPAGTNNFFGLKAHSYPGFANFDTPEQGAEYYAQTIKALVPDLDKIKNDPIKVLTALQSGASHYEGDNPDPMQYVYDISNNPVWKAFGQSAMKQNPNGWKR